MQKWYGGRGVKGHAGLAPGGHNLLHRAVQMHAGLHMHGQQIRAGGDKGPHIALRRIHHQMHIQRQAGGLAHSLDDLRAKADVGHKAAIHHIQMDIIGTPGLGLADLLCQIAKIRGEDGWGQLDRWPG